MSRREAPGAVVTLGGRYRLRRRIALGGMGMVWEGMDTVLGRPVAVKVLSPALAADERFVERFRREARAAAGLAHGNIAQVYDYGEDGPTRFIVMELVPGETLADRLRRDGPLEPAEAARIGAEAADALEAAHRAGIVHRDVKPENIMLTPSAEVKVMDFGIAAAAQYSSLTTTGSLLGTATYMSPEHASGSLVTGASDVYSLAVVLYEMLTGRPPFAMETPVATALAHVNAEPEPISTAMSGVPPRLAKTVELGLAKDPSRRPQSAAAFAGMLRGDGQAGQATAARAAASTRPPSADRTIPRAGPIPTRRLATATVPLSRVGPTGTARLPGSDPPTTHRPARRRPLLAVLLVVGAALLVWALVAAIPGGGRPTPGPAASPRERPPVSPSSAPGVKVPASIIGMSKHDAEAALQQLGLAVGDVVKVKTEPQQPDGVVIKSVPAPGTVVNPGAPVTLYVSDSGHGHGHNKKEGPD